MTILPNNTTPIGPITTPIGDGLGSVPIQPINIPPFWTEPLPGAQATPNSQPFIQQQVGNATGFIYVSLTDIENMISRVIKTQLESYTETLLDKLIERVKKEDL